MPRYDYRCPAGHTFEQYAHRDADVVACACGEAARRRPYSGLPQIKGETVARDIPDPIYREEREKRDLNRSWGDGSRSLELIRQNVFTDDQGRKQLDVSAINKAGQS